MDGKFTGRYTRVGSDVPFDVRTLPIMEHFEGGGTPRNITFDARHVIPTDSIKKSEFLKHLEKMETDGVAEPLWEQNKFARNGLPLPNTPECARILNSAKHSGYHKYYSQFIDTVLEHFEKEYQKQLNNPELDSWLKANAKKINGLVAYLKVELTNPKSDIKLHSVDPNMMDVEADSKSKFVWGEMKKLIKEDLAIDDKIAKHPAYLTAHQADPNWGLVSSMQRPARALRSTS